MFKKLLTQFICLFIPISKRRVSIIDATSFSGSNPYAIFEYIYSMETKEILAMMELKIFQNKNNNQSYGEKIRNFYYKASSSVIISSHPFNKYKRKQKLIQLWHGVPLKNMGLLDKGNYKEWLNNTKKSFEEVDVIISLSEFYITLLNSTIGQTINKYKILGYPRNDYLLSDNNIDFKEIFKGYKIENKVVFYMPTFKIGFGSRIEGNSKDENFFGIQDLDLSSFSRFLINNNINLVVKLHPVEERFYQDKHSILQLENIFFLSNEILMKTKKDIYQYLSKSDMLITDYSSVYFDYLLTGKKMLFVNVDENEYRTKRGFLLEPYEYWTPGPKVVTQEMLEREILNLFDNDWYYANEREHLLKIFHNYPGNVGNCRRVWDFIKEEYLQLGKST